MYLKNQIYDTNYQVFVVACIVAVLSGALMYVLFIVGFNLESCLLYILLFILVVSEIIVENDII
jgi:hypothetical protein